MRSRIARWARDRDLRRLRRRSSSGSVTFVISDEAAKAIHEIAKLSQVPIEQVLVNAISREWYITKELSRGSKIVLAKSDGKFVELRPA